VDSRVSDVVQGYTRLASSLLERWSELASKTASRVDAGAYDAASATEDVIEGSWLATEGAGLWAAQTFSAYATLAGYEPAPNLQTSQPFTAPKGAKLDLLGSLVRGPGPDHIPASAISVQPPQLGPEQTEFTVKVDGTGCRGGTYVGVVSANTEAETKTVDVWISIP
jgi:hypothetical protein